MSKIKKINIIIYVLLFLVLINCNMAYAINKKSEFLLLIILMKQVEYIIMFHILLMFIITTQQNIINLEAVNISRLFMAK